MIVETKEHCERRVLTCGLPLSERMISLVWPIRTYRDAEEGARLKMVELGFIDARLTNNGPDGGVDIVASNAVAQVKAQVNPVGAAVVQAIYGIACSQASQALCFSLAGFTDSAATFADRAGVAIFTFDLSGQALALNRAALAMERLTSSRRWNQGAPIDPVWSVALGDEILDVSVADWGVLCLCEASLVGLDRTGRSLFDVDVPRQPPDADIPSLRYCSTPGAAFAVLWRRQSGRLITNELVRCLPDGRVQYQSLGIGLSRLVFEPGRFLLRDPGSEAVYYLMNSDEVLAVQSELPPALMMWFPIAHLAVAGAQMLEVSPVIDGKIVVRVREPVRQVSRPTFLGPKVQSIVAKTYWTTVVPCGEGEYVVGPLPMGGIVVVGAGSHDRTYVHGIRIHDGEVAWKSDRLSEVIGLFALGEDEVLVVRTQSNMRLRARDGVALGELALPDLNSQEIRVAVDGKTIVSWAQDRSTVGIQELKDERDERLLELRSQPETLSVRDGILATGSGSTLDVYSVGPKRHR